MGIYVFFFFQAEDGIRDGTVTGVQTCALPISWHVPHHGAQKSTITGMSFRVIWRSKVAASALIGVPANSGWWQVPHLACRPGRSGGTRLMAPHEPHTT